MRAPEYARTLNGLLAFARGETTEFLYSLQDRFQREFNKDIFPNRLATFLTLHFHERAKVLKQNVQFT